MAIESERVMDRAPPGGCWPCAARDGKCMPDNRFLAFKPAMR
jgi:hypothetical protein